jgi:hypothetical protein
MRIPILTAVAASVALFALPAAAHGWVEDRDDTVVMVRECPLPAPPSHHHFSRVAVSHHHWAHAAVRCQVAEAPPVEERVVRVYHHEDTDAWRGDHDGCDGDRCGDRGRDHGWRGADGDRDMDQDHGMAMRHDDGGQGAWDDHARAHVDGAVHHEEEDRRAWDDREKAQVDGAVRHEEEDRRGWDDHQYAQRDGGMHRDDGDGRWRGVYHEERERTFEHGEHWIGNCGCGPVRPTTTDEYGYLVWAGKVAPPDEPDSRY